MSAFVRISNASNDPHTQLTVTTHRQDIAPGEPGALRKQTVLRAGEVVLVEIPHGAAIAITEADVQHQQGA